MLGSRLIYVNLITSVPRVVLLTHCRLISDYQLVTPLHHVPNKIGIPSCRTKLVNTVFGDSTIDDLYMLSYHQL